MASDSLPSPLIKRTPYRIINTLNRALEMTGDPHVEIDSLERLIELNDGYIYIAHLELTPFYKIGKAVDVAHRLNDIMRVESPLDLILTHSIKTNYMPVLEHGLHDRYFGKHWRGEWYTLDEGDIADLRQVEVYNFPEVEDAKEFVRDYHRCDPPAPPQPIDFMWPYFRVFNRTMPDRQQLEEAS